MDLEIMVKKLSKIFGRERICKKDKENYIMKNFTNCTPYHMFLDPGQLSR
jgi:hypothetical protein